MSARAERRHELAPDDPRHGTRNGYDNHYCRCDRCRNANRISHASYMAANRAQREAHATRTRERYWNNRTIRREEALDWLRDLPGYRELIRQRLSAAAKTADQRARRIERDHADVDYIGREIEGCG